jgi:hypothetical protein
VVAARFLQLDDLFELDLFQAGGIGYRSRGRLGKLPEAIKKCFQNRRLSLEKLQQCEHQDRPDGFVDRLRKPNFRSLLFPSTVVGPDGYADLAPGISLAFGCRLYSNNLPVHSHSHNVRTTALFKCYMKRNEEKANPACADLRRAAIKALKSSPRSVLRFVFSFPGCVHGHLTKEWWVDGKDLVVIISRKNSESFFGNGELGQRMADVMRFLYT